MIRKATLEDLDEIYNLEVKSVLFHQKFNNTFYNLTSENELMLKKQLIHFLKSNENYFLVKCIQNKIIGFIRVDVNKDCFTIGDIFIEEEYRMNGYGKELFLESLKLFESNDVKFLKVDVDFRNEDTIKFYESLGFEKFSVKMIQWRNKEK